MLDHGMQANAVEAVGRDLQTTYAEAIRRVLTQLDQMVAQSQGNWVGKRADEFRSWWPAKRGRLSAIADDLHAYGQSALDNAAEQRTASGEFHAGVGSPTTLGPPSPVVSLRDLIRLPPDEQVAAWRQMSRQEQAALLKGKESSIGEFTFMAPEIRYAANRQLVFEQWAALNARDTQHHGLSGSDLLREKLYERILREHQNVLFFDPSGDGRIAVVQGDLSHAGHVAVTVPGISNNLDNFGSLIDEGSRLKGAAGSDTAVVSWLGYDTPVGVGLNPIRMSAEIANTALARAGAQSLVPFVAGLRQLNPDAQVTVIGHSYGSLVTGLAAKAGLQADNVVFIGSPGVGVHSVSEFNLPAGAHVYAAEPGAGVSVGGVNAGGDPVSNLGHNVHPFGAVPTGPGFGAKVLNIGNRLDITASHSDYYKNGSTSLELLGKIAGGEELP